MGISYIPDWLIRRIGRGNELSRAGDLHDFLYAKGGTEEQRLVADILLWLNFRKTASGLHEDGHKVRAFFVTTCGEIAYQMVRIFGVRHFSYVQNTTQETPKKTTQDSFPGRPAVPSHNRPSQRKITKGVSRKTRRKPFTRFRLNGVDWPLAKAPRRALKGDLGMCEFNTMEILLANDLREDALRQTALHEVLHVLTAAAGIDLKDEHCPNDEHDRLAQQLFAALNDPQNTPLWGWIGKGAWTKSH